MVAQNDNTKNSLSRSTERPRTVLIEGFSSSTCGPCLPGNINLKNVIEQNQGKYALIKYQMNWPGNGDPYYTLEGYTRRTVYSVGAVPYIRLNGTLAPSNLTNTLLNQQQAIAANMDLEVDFRVSGKTVSATVTITPATDISGTNLRLYVAIVERETYNNWQNNGERTFYQIMKKFMPDANGIILSDLSANVPVVFEQEWEFQGEYRKPNNALSPINHAIEHSIEDFDNLSIIAWVQNTSTKAVLQACDAGPYLLKYSAATQNGTISATVNGDPIGPETIVEQNTEVTFIASPNDGFEVKEWKFNQSVVPGVTTNEFTKVIDRGNTNITVDFHQSHFNVNYSTANDFGTIIATVEDDEIESGDEVRRGSKVVFTAIPNDGYEVRNWKNNGTTVSGNTTNQYTINSLNNNVTVTVEFQTTHLTVYYDVINNLGTIVAVVNEEAIESGDSIRRGSQIFFTASPNEGSSVKEWKNNGIIIPNNTTTQYVISSLSININVTVEFSSSHFKVNFDTFNEFGSISASVDNDEIESGDLVLKSSQVTFTATPNEEYEVKEWKNNGTIVTNNNTNKYIIETLDDDVEVTVEFMRSSGINSSLLSKTNLYPNPFTNNITVSNAENVQTVVITNILGQTVKEIKLSGKSQISIDTEDFALGVYLINLQALNGEKIVYKIVKRK